MNILVRAAHFIRQTHIYRDCVKGALQSRGGLSAPSLLRKVDDALFGTGDCVYKIRGEVFVRRNIFDDISAQCSEDDRHALRMSLHYSSVIKDYRFKLSLSVEPSMKVGALKSLLKATCWIPQKNFLLVKDKEISLDDDKSLIDCGIVEEDSVLLACMGGSYPLTLHHIDPPEPDKEFVIPISSCFETVGELKKKIHKITGKTPNDQVVFYQYRRLTDSDNTTLVVCGIVRQYSRYMPKMSKCVEMLIYTDDMDIIESAKSELAPKLEVINCCV